MALLIGLVYVYSQVFVMILTRFNMNVIIDDPNACV